MFRGTRAEREYERRINESLADEYIIEPETGAKLTLEEAESGHWIKHDNEYSTIPEKEIEKLHTEEEKDAERAINYLRKSTDYKRYRFSESELELLENTRIFSKYDDWSYSNCFKIEYCRGFIFMPAVVIIDKVPGYFETTYNESQIMVWLKLKTSMGHYYLREKSGTEKFLDIFKKEDALKLKNYESFTFKKSENIFRVNQILEKFTNVRGIEIEIFGNNLFFKTLKFINKTELLQIEKLVKSLA